jgi:hypothetical protein
MRRHLLTGLLALLTVSLFSCRIYDDKSELVLTNPVLPEDYTLSIFAIDQETIPSGGVSVITVQLLKINGTDTTEMSGAKIDVDATGGELNASEITTSSSGKAAVEFTATLAEDDPTTNFDVVFTYGGSALKETATISVTNSTGDIQDRTMRLEINQPVILADGNSTTEVFVAVVTPENTPLAGETIKFSCTAGTILASNGGVTDANGKATAVLTSERRNIDSYVTAVMNSDSTKVATSSATFSGVKISSVKDKESIVPDSSDRLTVTATVKDGADKNIAAELITFSTNNSSLIIIEESTNDTTDNYGVATCVIVRSKTNPSTQDTLFAEAAGAYDTVLINYSDKILTINVAGDLVARDSNTTTVTVKYTENDKSTPIANANINLSTTLGYFVSGDSVNYFIGKTNSSGILTTTLTNPNFTGKATLKAVASLGADTTSATKEFSFSSGVITKITLSGTPEVISTGGAQATISATAFDGSGNLVAGQDISFQVLNGSGGGEVFDYPTARTDVDGIASVQLISSNTPSEQHGVKVTATSFSGVKSIDTLKFTIANPVKNINITANIREIEIDPNGGYGIKLECIVSDINGNPVPDGTPVTFSSRKAGYAIYRRWAVITGTKDGLISAVASNFEVEGETKYLTLEYEDVNNNYFRDPNESERVQEYPVLLRGEDFVWKDYDDEYLPGPAFNDYNGNGRLDIMNVEPYWYDADVHIDAKGVSLQPVNINGNSCWYFDLNENGYYDYTETLRDGVTLQDYKDSADVAWEKSWDLYADTDSTRRPKGYGDYDFPDIDWNQNGIPDPVTAYVIEKEVLTVGGKAPNVLHYGQNDGKRLCLEIWAESKGIRTQNNLNFYPLPISEAAKSYWHPFDVKRWYY